MAQTPAGVTLHSAPSAPPAPELPALIQPQGVRQVQSLTLGQGRFTNFGPGPRAGEEVPCRSGCQGWRSELFPLQSQRNGRARGEAGQRRKARKQSQASLGREPVEIGSAMRRHWGPDAVTGTAIVTIQPRLGRVKGLPKAT